MAFFTCEDLPYETIAISAKEITCPTKSSTKDDTNCSHEFSHNSVIATESSQEGSMHHFTMESDIDKTAELLPSGSTQSLQNGIKTAVTETSSTQLSTIFNPKVSDDPMEKQPSLFPPMFSQGKNFIQQRGAESTKKWVQPEDVLDMGTTEPQSNDTIDLYCAGTYGTHQKRPNFTESIKQYGSLQRKSDDDDANEDDQDLYTDKFSEDKHISLLHPPPYMNDASREIKSKLEIIEERRPKSKVWNTSQRAGKKLESGINYQMGSKETGHEQTDKETLLFKSTEHGSQANSPLCQDAVRSQKFPYVLVFREMNATDDIKLENLKQLQDGKTEDLIAKHNACYLNQTEKLSDCISEEIHPCEGASVNDETQKDENFLKANDNKKDQMLEIENDVRKLYDEYANSKETYDNMSAITSIHKVPSSPVTVLPLEGISNENTDKTLCYEGRLSAQPNVLTCTSQEDRTLSTKDTGDQLQICPNNVVIESIGTHNESNGDTKMIYSEARNNLTNQLELKKNRDPSSEKVDTRESTPMPKELSSSQSHQINGITPGDDVISTDSSNGSKTIKNSSKSFKKAVDTELMTFDDERCAKHSSSEANQTAYFEVIDQQDQVSSNCVNIDKHCSMDDSNVLVVTKKPCDTHGKYSEMASQKESPEKIGKSLQVMETKSNRDNNDTVTGSQTISNKRLQVNLQISRRSSDLSINSRKLTSKPTCTLTNLSTCFSNSSNSFEPPSPGESSLCASTFSDPSLQSLTTFPGCSHQYAATSLDSLYQNRTNSLDPTDQCPTVFPESIHQSERNSDLSYESTIASDDPLNECTGTISDSANHCMINSLDLSNECKTTVQESSVKSHDPSGQITSDFHNLTYQETNSSSNSYALCTTTCTDQSDHCKMTTSDSSYEDKFNSLKPSDQSSTMNADSPIGSIEFSFNLSDLCLTSNPDSDKHCRNNTGDLSHHVTRISSDQFNNCNTSALDGHKHYPPINLGLAYKSKIDPSTDPSDSSAICKKNSSGQSNHNRTTTPDSSYQGKFICPPTSDQSSTMNLDSPIGCSDSFLNLSDQCPSPSLDSASLRKTNSSDLSYHFISISSDPLNHCTNNVADGTNQCTPLDVDSNHQWKNDSSATESSALCAQISIDQSDHIRNTMLDSSYENKPSSVRTTGPHSALNPDSTLECTDSSSPSDKCTSAFDQCKTITDPIKINSLDTSYAPQCSVPSLYPSDQCTTFFPESTNQRKKDSSDLSYQCTPTSSEPSNQCPTTVSDSFYQRPFTSGEQPDKYTDQPTNSSDLIHQWKNNSSDISDQCSQNYSASSKHRDTALNSSDQHSITFLEPIGHCTTMTSDPTYKLSKNSRNSLYDDTVTTLGCLDQSKTTSLSKECTTISLDSSHNILPPSESNHQYTSCPTPPHNFITNPSDLHENDSSDSACPSENYTNNSYVTMTQNPTMVCRRNSVDPIPQSNFINANQSLKLSASTYISDPCTIESSGDIYKCRTTPLSQSTCEDMATLHGFSYQCTDDFSNDIDRLTNQHDQGGDNSIDPINQTGTLTTSSSHQCRTTSNASHNCTTSSDPYCPRTSSPNSPQHDLASCPDLCTSTTNPDLPSKSMVLFGGPHLPDATISLLPSCEDSTTSTESPDQCADIYGDFQLSLPCNIKDRLLVAPTQDEYGGVNKQCEGVFLGEIRRIFLDNQDGGFSLLDSGLILIKAKQYLGNTAVMILRNGEELGTVIHSSKLFLYYQLDKHFYITQQLNQDWYYTQDRMTKATMLMKKVPLTSNWLKTLHNFLCLPNNHRLLTPYAVVTDRNGFILFLMEDRDVLGVGRPPLGYVLNTMENLSKVLCFMRYCWIHKVLPRKITTSILYTAQGIWFDPSSLCNNEDLCEFNKCLKECLLTVLFNGQQEEFDGIVDLLVERAQLLLQEDWSPQICLARLLFAPIPGALPFCFPSFSNEN
ncbi:serine-rich adhesin for platelets-like [Dendropsophus ebraccatus]|uniref:serine-rich adhesin for platelets-like n=1 Tax=Dendropsophus ebraccatus TaxID=150705 RepID=UPI0038310965